VIAAGTSGFFLPFLRMCQNFFAQKVKAVINYLLKTFEVKKLLLFTIIVNLK
jgi:hypothetical protein